MTDPAPPVPRLDLILGLAPALLLAAAGIASWLLPPLWAGVAVAAGTIWGGAILAFMAGVTRGLSFLTAGGPQRGQVAAMGWLFALAFGSMIAPTWIALILLAMGYATIALYDPPAARLGWAPASFARLRPVQMAVAVAGLMILLARVTLAA